MRPAFFAVRPLFALLLAAQPAALLAETASAGASATILSMDEARLDACTQLALDDPAGGIVQANQWRIDGGRWYALQCLGFAHAERDEFDQAERNFITAAREAEAARDERAAHLWVQAGNAALADGRAQKALAHFDAALVQGTLSGLAKGELHLDRARALVALDRLEDAKSEFTVVHKLAGQDPLAWLLSATLARRMGEYARAASDISVAAQLAPTDPAISLEIGNIAAAEGDYDRAREQWQNAVRLGKDSDAGQAAARHLSDLDASEGKTAAPAANPPAAEPKAAPAP